METKKRGAPKKENKATELIHIRCTPDEKKLWQSKSGDIPLTRWLKKLANEGGL